LLDAFSDLKLSLATRICLHIVRNATSIHNPECLTALVNKGIASRNNTTFNLTLEILETIYWAIDERSLDLKKLLERLDPKMHSRLILVMGLSRQPDVWKASVKNLIQSKWLYLVEHPLEFEDKRVATRLLARFLTSHETNDNRLECFYWMLIMQSSELNDLVQLIDEQLRQVNPRFLQKLSMLLCNLDVLVVLRKSLALNNKLGQVF
jgi:hypothetical protein